MAQRTDTDMTKGNPMSIILRFTIPLLLGNIFQQFYNIVDTIIVGHFVGEAALAAVGSTGTVMFLVIGISNGMVTGFTILTSQKYGAKEADKTKATVTNGLYLSAVVAVILTVVSLSIMKPLLRAMHTPENIFDYAYTYISTICAGVFCAIMYNFFSSLMRAIGNSKMPLVFLIFSACLNILLDLLFIIVFKLETFGAALATVLSQFVAAILCVIYLYAKIPVLRPDRKDWAFNRSIALAQVKLGLPMAVQYGITASGTVIMQSAFNMFGDIAVGAITASSKFQGIITQGQFTIGQTMAAYAGQNYGSRNMQRIKDGIKAALKIYIVYSLVAGVLANLCLPYVIRVFFSKDVDINAYLVWARPYIFECAICYFFLAMIFIYRHSIQSVGYASTAMLLGLIELVARLITSFYSMHVHNYYIAVASDPLAWMTAGIAGLIISRIVFKKIETRWAEK